MNKQEAFTKGYCPHCAAYHVKAGFNCGVGMGLTDNVECRLPDEAVSRWKGEFGLEGTTQRHHGEFGDVDLMKKKRGRANKRYLK
jgi:hypothetical protein